MTSSVQFLFATMNGALFERNPKVLARAEDYLVIDQRPPNQPLAPDARPHTVSVQESGLSKSRNLALKHATAELCYLCDDDIELAPDAPERVRQAFEQNPEADILIFARGTSFSSRPTKRRLPERLRKALPTSLRLLGASSIQIAFRREAVLARSIQFDERFGLGAEFPTAEEAIFLSDCLRAGLEIEWVDTLVASHELESSGARYADRDLAVAKGAMLSRIFGKKRRAAALAFALKSLPLYRHHLNPFGFLEALERGAALHEAGSATPALPSQAKPTAQPDSLAFFAALNQSEIRYAAWKDLQELESFHYGDAEIDLLLHPGDMTAFRHLCRQEGYSEFINRLDLYAGAVSHFIRFAHGRHFHLHVHSALLTGDHTAKEFDLTPFLDSEFFRGPIRNEVRTLKDHSELAIGMIRLLLKARNPSGIKMDELHRLRAVSSEATLKSAFEWIGAQAALSSSAQNSLTRLLAGEDDEIANLPRYEEAFSSFRRMSQTQARLNRFRMRISNFIARRDALANKILAPKAPEQRHAGAGQKAPTLAIIGVDGSGKTTLCDSVTRILRAKISVKRIYLGSNSETYSIRSRMAHLASGGIGRLHNTWPHSGFLGDLKWLTRALLEYSKCHDRVSEIRRGERYARQGVFVLYERYPLKHLFDYPTMAAEIERGEINLEGWMGAKTRSLLMGIDRLLERTPLPDTTVLVQTNFDQIRARRDLRPEESKDIQRKLALLEGFDASNIPGLDQISNEGRSEETLETVLQRVNQQLCSRNS